MRVLLTDGRRPGKIFGQGNKAGCPAPSARPNWTGFYVGAFGGINLEALVSILAWAEIGIFVPRIAT
jgi:hypothetical protein